MNPRIEKIKEIILRYRTSIILAVIIFISSLVCTALLVFAVSQSNRINDLLNINNPTPTLESSPTPTFTPTLTPSETPTPTLTISPTPTPTLTNTPISTTKPTNTAVPTSIPTDFPSEISRGNTGKKQVIFTFDAGSGTQSAQDILDIAAAHGLTLSFFLTGKWAEQNPGLTQTIANAGHEIYNHTYSHPRLPDIGNNQITEELNKTSNIISNLTGKSSKPYFRLPYGYHGGTGDSNRVLSLAWSLGYRSVLWSCDALDWWDTSVPYNGQTVNDEFVKNRIYSNLKNGALYLMHVGDNITGNILNEVFTKIENDGYKIVPLSEGL